MSPKRRPRFVPIESPEVPASMRETAVAGFAVYAYPMTDRFGRDYIAEDWCEIRICSFCDVIPSEVAA